METKHEEIRFGMVAVKMGFVTPEQVVKALEIQVTEDLSQGSHRRIGKILLDQRLIDQGQIDEIVQSM